MKLPSIFSVLMTGSLLFAQAAIKTEDQWLAQDGREISGGFLLPGKGSSPELRMSPAAGVSAGEAPSMGGDRKSLVFDGNQSSAFRTEAGYRKALSGIRVIVDVKIPEEIGENDGTILRHGTSWELRYVPGKSIVVFVVWHDASHYTEVRVPALPGEWQTIDAAFAEEQMSVSNGKDKATAVPPTGIRVESADPPLLLGASTPIVADKQSGRPFTGAVANIRVGVE